MPTSDPNIHARQFTLAAGAAPSWLSGWQALELGDGLVLRAHPTLTLTECRRGDRRLVLLGYILDPHHPDRQNAEILDDLLGRTSGPEDIADAAEPLGGRWAMIAERGRTRMMLHDAAGMRSVYYCGHEGAIACATQPGLLRELFGLPPSPEAQAFVASGCLPKNGWWPGDRVLELGVRRLLPNHWLDLAQGRTVRFWPRSRQAPLAPGEASRIGADILRGMWRSAVARFGRIALPVTAGMDSRILLAASREVTGNLFHFISLQPHVTEGSPDIWVPQALARKMGFLFHVLPYDEDSLQAYLDAYLAHNDLARPSRLPDLYAKYPGWPEGVQVVASGNVNEITRGYYQRQVFRGSPGTFAAAASMGRSRYAVQRFGEWCAEARPTARTGGQNLLDLFFWEHIEGGLHHMAFLEMDFDHETLMPFNSRQYLATLLRVPKRFRCRADRGLFIDMIRRMWPEALSQPINPAPPAGPAVRLHRALVHSPLVMKVYHQLKAWTAAWHRCGLLRKCYKRTPQ